MKVIDGGQGTQCDEIERGEQQVAGEAPFGVVAAAADRVRDRKVRGVGGAGRIGQPAAERRQRPRFPKGQGLEGASRATASKLDGPQCRSLVGIRPHAQENVPHVGIAEWPQGNGVAARADRRQQLPRTMRLRA